MLQQESRGVVLKLVFCILSFYAVFYTIASLLHGIFVFDSFDGRIPFHFDSFQNMFSNATATWNQPIFLADFLSLECTCLLSPLAFVVYVHERLWDFVVTTVLLHVIIVCIVNLTFPFVWEWWMCIVTGLLCMILLGESINACCHRKKNIDQNKGK